MNRLRRTLFVVGASILAAGWGSVGHRIINGNAFVHLPPAMTLFIQNTQFLADHASDPDNRKGGDSKKSYLRKEGPRHFIDIDEFPEFPTRSVPQNLGTLIGRSDSATIFGIGVVPWAIVWSLDSLTEQLRRNDVGSALQTAADLGHYVGDAHQPLHCTRDYNGRASDPGSDSIHSRYESGMISAYQNLLAIRPDSVRYIVDPIGFVFDFVYQSNSLVDSVYIADSFARQFSGWNGEGPVPQNYIAALWEKTRSFTQLQFQRASENYASLLYTAWVNAGSPVVTSVRTFAGRVEIPREPSLDQNFPNPFNPATTISFRLQDRAKVTLKVFSLRGQQIAELANGTFGPGTYRLGFDATAYSLSSGLYLYRLDVDEMGKRFTMSNKMLYLK